VNWASSDPPEDAHTDCSLLGSGTSPDSWQDAQLVDPSNPHDGVVGRRTADSLLSSVYEQQVTLTGQADLKANIIITASSLALSISVGRGWQDNELRPTVIVLAIGVLAALTFAVLAVLPKFSTRPTSLDRAEGGDLLFFAQFARLPLDAFQRDIAALLRDDAAIHHAMTANIHAQATYLLRQKYRYLKLAYLSFLAGFGAASLTQLITVVS
jgi:hypothetical protein